MTNFTLNTKSSFRRMARVLKPPSQMLGLEFGLEGLALSGGRWGLAWRSCLRGSEGGWKRGGGTVGGGRVGCGALSGGPKKPKIERILSAFLYIRLFQNFHQDLSRCPVSLQLFGHCAFYFGTETVSFFWLSISGLTLFWKHRLAALFNSWQMLLTGIEPNMTDAAAFE